MPHQKAYPAEIPNPSDMVRSTQKRFLSFPTIGAMGMVSIYLRVDNKKERVLFCARVERALPLWRVVVAGKIEVGRKG